MKESSFRNRQGVVDYGQERDLLQEGEKPEVIIGRLRTYEKEFGYNPFKANALEVIIESLDRKKRGKNPSITGSFTVESRRHGAPEVKGSANPRDYLNMVLEEFVEQTALETDFIEKFIRNNPNLDEDAKKFLLTTVASQIGPWFVRNHVSDVRQDGKKITIRHSAGEAFYYMK